jgi:hypothetical protein
MLKVDTMFLPTYVVPFNGDHLQCEQAAEQYKWPTKNSRRAPAFVTMCVPAVPR